MNNDNVGEYLKANEILYNYPHTGIGEVSIELNEILNKKMIYMEPKINNAVFNNHMETIKEGSCENENENLIIEDNQLINEEENPMPEECPKPEVMNKFHEVLDNGSNRNDDKAKNHLSNEFDTILSKVISSANGAKLKEILAKTIESVESHMLNNYNEIKNDFNIMTKELNNVKIEVIYHIKIE